MATDDAAKALIIELDGIARDVCHYEYGLPLFTDGAMDRMTAAIAAAIRAAVEAEWAACAEAADADRERAVRAAVEAQRERDAAKVERGIELLRLAMKDAMDGGGGLGEALRRSVEIDGALLALHAIREGTQ